MIVSYVHLHPHLLLCVILGLNFGVVRKSKWLGDGMRAQHAVQQKVQAVVGSKQQKNDNHTQTQVPRMVAGNVLEYTASFGPNRSKKHLIHSLMEVMQVFKFQVHWDVMLRQLACSIYLHFGAA